MKKITFILCGIAIMLFQSNLKAQLYWSESFGSYTDGQIINGINRWDLQNATAGYAPTSVNPLTYGNLKTDARYIIGGGGWTAAGVTVPMTYPSQYFDDFNGDGQWLTCGYKTGGSNELWFSMLVRPDVNADFQIWLNSSHIPWQSQKPGNLFIIRKGGKWGLTLDGPDTAPATVSSIDATVGTTYLLTAKVNFTASNTTISLYVNPTIGTTPTVPTATATSTSPLLFYSIGMFLNSNANSVSLDEMRIGKTYSDVTPQGISTNINNLNEFSLSVYPNPATEYLTLQTGKNGAKADLCIIDMEGRVLMANKSLENGSRISLANLNNGNYMLKIVSNCETKVRQLIIKK